MAVMSALHERKLLLRATANDARTFYFPEAWHRGAWKARPRRRKPRSTFANHIANLCRPWIAVVSSQCAFQIRRFFFSHSLPCIQPFCD